MNVQNDLGRGLPVCGTGLRAIRIFGLSGLLLPALAFTQVLQPLAIPPLLDMDTFDLVVDDHVHQFFQRAEQVSVRSEFSACPVFFYRRLLSRRCSNRWPFRPCWTWIPSTWSWTIMFTNSSPE